MPKPQKDTINNLWERIKELSTDYEEVRKFFCDEQRCPTDLFCGKCPFKGRRCSNV